MSALINSFTPHAILVITMPTVDFVKLPHNLKTTIASTTITTSGEFGLNVRIHKLLEEFSSLTDNWDEDGALAPDTSVLKRAESLTTLLEKHGQPIFHTAPGPNGEVVLDIRNKAKSRSVEIIFYNTRTTVVYFPSEGSPYQEPFDIQNLPKILEWLNNSIVLLWNKEHL